MSGDIDNGTQNSIKTSEKELKNFMGENQEHEQKRRREEKKDRKEQMRENNIKFSNQKQIFREDSFSSSDQSLEIEIPGTDQRLLHASQDFLFISSTCLENPKNSTIFIVRHENSKVVH